MINNFKKFFCLAASVPAAFLSMALAGEYDLPNRAELAKQADDKLAAMDTDNSGTVSLSEYSKDCAINKGMNETTHAVQIARDFKSVDADKDGKLIQGEIIGTILWADADKQRKVLDANGDNWLNSGEYLAGQAEGGKATAQERFSKMDTNKDGNIVTGELFQGNVNVWLNGPGSDKRVAETKAAESKGSEAKESETKGSATKGSAVKAAEAKGSEAKEAVKGSAVKAAKVKGSEVKVPEIKGSGSQ